jgi:hypothetical protein
MRRIQLAVAGGVCFLAALAAIGADKSGDNPVAKPTYRLEAVRKPGDRSEVAITLTVGGDVIYPGGKDGAAPTKLPLSVDAKLEYREQLIAWNPDPAQPSRSIRRYSAAQATIKTEEKGLDRSLPDDRQLIVAELAPDGPAIAGIDDPLTRDQFDLLDVPANTLAIDRLLPNREVREGEYWDHDADVMGPLLGMDHVAVCEVRSVVTGQENGQVKIRLAGAVQGTVEGAATEMTLRAAYLFHLKERRITKLNLAIDQETDPDGVTAGMDVVARLTLASKSAGVNWRPFEEAVVARAAKTDLPTLRQLLVDQPQRGFRLRHDQAWYVTSDHQHDLMSYRLLRDGDFVAHCNITTQPGRPIDKPLTLHDFETEVAQSLDEKVEEVASANEWDTASGCRCLAVIVRGHQDEIPLQWRYYRLMADGCPQVTLAVTLEQSEVDRFADADKALVETLELSPLPKTSPINLTKPAAESAAKPGATTK